MSLNQKKIIIMTFLKNIFINIDMQYLLFKNELTD